MAKVIGHILVQRSKSQDAAYCLGIDDWLEHFHVLPVSDDYWERLETTRLWHQIDAACGCIIDRYEEEWIEANDLPRLDTALAVFRAVNAARLEEQDTEFLTQLAAQVARARALSVPVIFLLD